MVLFFTLAGLILGLIGSIGLARSLNKVVQELRFAMLAHDTTIQQLTSSAGDIPVFTGLDRLLDQGHTRSSRHTITGIAMIALSFAFQLAAVLLSLL